MQVKQDAFYEINQIMARGTLSNYLGFNGIFKMHTNTSAFQLGAVISHKLILIAFYIIKPNGDHKRYTVIEK